MGFFTITEHSGCPKLRYRKIIICSDQRIALICANSHSSAAFEADALVLYKCSYMKLGKKLIPYG